MRIWIVILLCLILAWPRGVWVARANEPRGDTVRIMVGLRDIEGDVETRRELKSALREVRQISRLAPRRYVAPPGSRKAGDLRRWRVVEVDGGRSASMLLELASNPAVAEAYVERIYEAAVTPNDPLFARQYGLSSAAEPLADINAPAAWERTRGSSDTVIAVLDGGVDVKHEDLHSKLWRNTGEVAGNGRDDDGNGYVDDVNGWDFVVRGGQPAGLGVHKHATHVAGIAAADSNNGRGVTGVDWAARIMSVRVLNGAGVGREEYLVAGISYAVANGADIINMSIAGPPSPAIREAVENAYAAGVLVVAAAGNSGRDTTWSRVYPACAETGGINMVLGVGATDEDGEPARFSNYGPCVDVSTPGRRIRSAVLRDRYGDMSGTSMSAPMAAGVAGLYLALHPSASPSEIIGALRASLDPFVGRQAAEWGERYAGRLNAARVVGAPFSEEAVPTPTPSVSRQPSPPAGEFALSIEKRGPGSVAPGETATYAVVVRNAGSAAAAGVRVEDRFDRKLTFDSGASSGQCKVVGREVHCDGGNVAPGETVTFEVAFNVPVDIRCGSRLRHRSEVHADERGRSRRQANSERVTTQVVCN